MTASADRTIDALRSTHDELAAVVAGLSDENLTARSGASEWSVAQVLSHLGSGAEISLATLRSALAATPGPDQSFTQGVWARWNALGPRDQGAGFLAADEELVSAVEALTTEQRQNLPVKLGFLPSPMTVSGYTGMRLNEAAMHGWDVRVSLDPVAAVPGTTARLLAEHFATDLSFLLGLTAKADALRLPGGRRHPRNRVRPGHRGLGQPHHVGLAADGNLHRATGVRDPAARRTIDARAHARRTSR